MTAIDNAASIEEVATRKAATENEITVLKAKAYDLISAQSQIQQELQRVNQRIAQLTAQLRTTT